MSEAGAGLLRSFSSLMQRGLENVLGYTGAHFT